MLIRYILSVLKRTIALISAYKSFTFTCYPLHHSKAMMHTTTKVAAHQTIYCTFLLHTNYNRRLPLSASSPIPPHPTSTLSLFPLVQGRERIPSKSDQAASSTSTCLIHVFFSHRSHTDKDLKWWGLCQKRVYSPWGIMLGKLPL